MLQIHSLAIRGDLASPCSVTELQPVNHCYMYIISINFEGSQSRDESAADKILPWYLNPDTLIRVTTVTVLPFLIGVTVAWMIVIYKVKRATAPTVTNLRSSPARAKTKYKLQQVSSVLVTGPAVDYFHPAAAVKMPYDITPQTQPNITARSKKRKKNYKK